MLLVFFLPFVNCTVLVPFTAVTLYCEPLIVAFFPTLTSAVLPVLLSDGLFVAVGTLVGAGVLSPIPGVLDAPGVAVLSAPGALVGSALGEAEGAALALGAALGEAEGAALT